MTLLSDFPCARSTDTVRRTVPKRRRDDINHHGHGYRDRTCRGVTQKDAGAEIADMDSRRAETEITVVGWMGEDRQHGGQGIQGDNTGVLDSPLTSGPRSLRRNVPNSGYGRNSGPPEEFDTSKDSRVTHHRNVRRTRTKQEPDVISEEESRI
jgi:hypothetical protein